MSPFAPKRPCTWPGCGALTQAGRCEQHRKQERRELDVKRGTAASRGYDSRWGKARKAFLSTHPDCIQCQHQGRVIAATVVDHIRPHKGDDELFWDPGNWQALCKAHHDQKTAKHDGRWS